MQALLNQLTRRGAGANRSSQDARLESNIAHARRLCTERSTKVTHDALVRLGELIELHDHANMTAKEALELEVILQQAVQTQQ